MKALFHNTAKRMTAVLLCVLFIAASALSVSAADTSVIFGRNDKFRFSPESTDLFDGFKGVIPGDTLTQTITVENESDRTVEIFMRAEGVEDDYKPFLSHIDITVEATRVADFLGITRRELYKAPASSFGDSPATLRSRVSLGEFSSGATVTMTVTAEISLEMGDEYQDALGEIIWVFTAEDDEAEDTTATEETTEEETTDEETTAETTAPYYPPYIPPYTPPYNPPYNPPVNPPTQPDIPQRVEVEIEPTPEPVVEPEIIPTVKEPLEDIELGDVPLAPEQPDAVDSTAADLDISIPDILVPLGGLIPQTGDDWAIFITCAAAIAATVIIVVLVIARKRLDEDENAEKNDLK